VGSDAPPDAVIERMITWEDYDALTARAQGGANTTFSESELRALGTPCG
jgi:hypothetical protein